MKRLFRHRRVRNGLIHLAAWYLDVTLRSKRWTFDGVEHLGFLRSGESAIIAFWHEMLPLMPALAQEARRIPDYVGTDIHFLVSRHNDGQFIGAIMDRFRMTPVFGSSSRGGPAAMHTMARLLRTGALIGITPDGPRGPRRDAAAGVVQLAALAGVPIIPCGGAMTHGPRLSSWDRMMVPLPFGRGVLCCGAPITVPRDAWREALPTVTARMNAAMDRAESLCSA